jgi:imidazoleglycerol phosphate dehydratase HisB
MKGSTVQREVKDQKASVLKDINYFNSNDCFIYLSKNTKNRLMKQVKDDILMLKKHNIMDYSLLLGVANSKVKKSKRIRRYSSSFSNININKTEGSKASSI